MFRQYLLLFLIDRFRGDRSISAVFHLLTGKKTSQTIQDGFTYQVHPFFKGLPTLTREVIDTDYKTFLSNHFVVEHTDSGLLTCQLTEGGQQELTRLQTIYELPNGLNGWQTGGRSEIFWRRLTLVVQTISHLLYNNRHYVTVTGDLTIQEWVKGFLLNASYTRQTLAERLFQELILLLETRPPLQQTLLTHRLTGYQKEGVTFDQLSYYLDKEKEELYLNYKAGLDASLSWIQQQLDVFPILSQFIDTDSNHQNMTHSAYETLIWLKKGLTVEAIAEKRRLKVSTIQDHFVELARYYPTPIRALCLTPDTEEAIQKILTTHSTRRLSELKKNLPEQVSYFQIRLTLMFQEGR